MATVQKLIDRLEYLVDDTMEPEIAVMLFNMCQEDLAEASGYTRVAESDFYTGLETITLPNDLIDVIEIEITGENEGIYRRALRDATVHPLDVYEVDTRGSTVNYYERVGDTIYLKPIPQYDGSLKIKYFAMLPEIPVDLNYVPKLKTRFHRLFSLFAAAKYMQNWKDEIPQKQDFWQEYLYGKEELWNETQTQRERHKSRFIYKTREWS